MTQERKTEIQNLIRKSFAGEAVQDFVAVHSVNVEDFEALKQKRGWQFNRKED